MDSHGEIQDISLDIADASSGGFQTAANSTVTTFSAQASDGISLSGNGANITLMPIMPTLSTGTQAMTAGGKTGSLGSISADDQVISRAATRIDEKTIQYRYDSKTTIEYSLTYTGFKEDIVVSEYTGQTEYAFTLRTGGYGLEEMNSSYFLVDDAGNIKATIGDIIIFTADQRNNTMGQLVPTTIVENQEYLLTIVVDPEFLADENTEYPIRIDPTLEVNYDQDGAGAIQDATVYTDDTTNGYLGSIFVGLKQNGGIARILMKFPGLDLSSLGEDIQIQSATVTLRDLLCESTSLDVYCHVYIGTIWDESNVCWDNTIAVSPNYLWDQLDMKTISYSIGTALSDQHRYSFNITQAVRGWLDEEYNQDKGIVFKAHDTVENGSTYNWRTLGSYNRASYKPSFSMTYFEGTSSITLSLMSCSILEGETRTLVANTNPAGQSITWSTNNSTVATVNSSGVITAKKAGTTTITASMVDPNGVTRTATCVVYVYIPSGVYYIKNMNSNYYLDVSQGGIANYTDVYQYSKYSPSSTANDYIIRQMWKIYHLGEGRYSVRPMNKPNMGLDVTNNNVDIFDIGETDTLSSVPSYGEWVIEWNFTGYVFKNNGNSNYTMQVDNAATTIGATIVAKSYSVTTNCRWELSKIASPPSGVYWYDTNNNAVVGTSTGTKYINEGATAYASDLGLIPILYSAWSNNQAFTWSSNNPAVASVDSSSGLISANLPGSAIITATSKYGYHKILFNLNVKSIDPFHSSNIQHMRYVHITGTNWWGLGGNTDHTVSIVKSTLLADDYCVIHDNINKGYYRALYINDELKTTLDNLEAGYQEHYNIIPAFNTTTDQESAAHSAKGETDELVDEGYFASGSSEYYGVWAFNYVSSLNLLDYWKGVIDTATAAYGVYLTLTSFYYSYLTTLNTNNLQVTSSQYQNAASILDDIDDAMYGMSYTNRTIVSSDSRNTALAQEGFTRPLPYKPQTPVVQYQQTSSTQYVRVFTTGSDGNKLGRWMMKYSDIQGLTPAQIQSKFALAKPPTHYCFVNVPAGKTIYIGVVNESSISGTLQYELVGKLSESYYGTSMLLP